jgi:hypothetical protein
MKRRQQWKRSFVEYLEAKREKMEKMTAFKANLEYCSMYLQKWMQLRNSGVPHEVLLAV